MDRSAPTGTRGAGAPTTVSGSPLFHDEELVVPGGQVHAKLSVDYYARCSDLPKEALERVTKSGARLIGRLIEGERMARAEAATDG